MTRNDDHVLNGRVAGFVTRLFAFTLDIVICVAIVATGGWIAVLFAGLADQLGLKMPVSLDALYVFFIPLIVAMYFVMFWSLTGRTVGKWLLGLRVIDERGHAPTIGHCVIRVIGYLVSMMVFWLGFVWVIVDDNRRAWHDHMARTWVVYDYRRNVVALTDEDFARLDHS